MTLLQVMSDNDAGEVWLRTDDATTIRGELATRGIAFERTTVAPDLDVNQTAERILARYADQIAAVNADGGVTPCCFLHNQKHDFGDLKAEAVDDLWNNDKYRSARSLFSRKPETGLKPTACNACPLFKQPNNRAEQRRIARARIEKSRAAAKSSDPERDADLIPLLPR